LYRAHVAHVLKVTVCPAAADTTSFHANVSYPGNPNPVYGVVMLVKVTCWFTTRLYVAAVNATNTAKNAIMVADNTKVHCCTRFEWCCPEEAPSKLLLMSGGGPWNLPKWHERN